MKKVCNYKRRHVEAQLLAEGNQQKNIACAWLREEWAGPVLAALQSSLRQQKSPCTLNTHIQIFQPHSVEGCCQNDSKCFQKCTKRINNCSSFFVICICCSQIFSQVSEMGFTHLEKYLLYSCCNTTAEHNTAKFADGGTNLKNTMCTRSQYHIWTTSVPLFSIPVSLHPAQFMIHELLAGSSPPSAVPPTCDHHSASTGEQVRDTCVQVNWTGKAKYHLVLS